MSKDGRRTLHIVIIWPVPSPCADSISLELRRNVDRSCGPYSLLLSLVGSVESDIHICIYCVYNWYILSSLQIENPY